MEQDMKQDVIDAVQDGKLTLEEAKGLAQALGAKYDLDPSAMVKKGKMSAKKRIELWKADPRLWAWPAAGGALVMALLWSVFG